MGIVNKWLDRELTATRPGAAYPDRVLHAKQREVVNRVNAAAAERYVLLARIDLAGAMVAAGTAEALSYSAAVLEAAERVLGTESQRTWRMRAVRAAAVHNGGMIGEALALLEDTIVVASQFSHPEHDSVLELRAMRGEVLQDAGRLAEAAAELDAVVAQSRSTDWQTMVSRRSAQFSAWNSLGRHMEALQGIEELTAEIGRLWDGTPSHRGRIARERGVAYRELGHLDQAASDLTVAVQLIGGVMGMESPMTLDARDALARTLIRLGRLGQAKKLADDTLRLSIMGRQRSVFLPIRATGTQAELRLAGGDYYEATIAAADAVRAATEYFDAWHPETLDYRFTSALARGALGEDTAAEHRAILEGRMLALGPDHPDTRRSQAVVAGDGPVAAQPGDAGW